MSHRSAFGTKSGSRSSKNTDLFRSQFHKTELCTFNQQAWCSKGDKCQFAHGEEELCRMPDLSKTSLCRQWLKHNCLHSSAECPYAHGDQELRMTDAFAKRRFGLNSKNRGSGEGNLEALPPPVPTVPRPRALPLSPSASTGAKPGGSEAGTSLASSQSMSGSSPPPSPSMARPLPPSPVGTFTSPGAAKGGFFPFGGMMAGHMYSAVPTSQAVPMPPVPALWQAQAGAGGAARFVPVPVPLGAVAMPVVQPAAAQQALPGTLEMAPAVLLAPPSPPSPATGEQKAGRALAADDIVGLAQAAYQAGLKGVGVSLSAPQLQSLAEGLAQARPEHYED